MEGSPLVQMQIPAAAIHPTGARMLIQVRQELASLASAAEGLLLPDTIAAKLAPNQGEILALGPRVDVRRFKVGDEVVYGLGVGFPVGPELLIINEKDVICKKEPD